MLDSLLVRSRPAEPVGQLKVLRASNRDIPRQTVLLQLTLVDTRPVSQPR
jgi:hypothetical protein